MRKQLTTIGICFALVIGLAAIAGADEIIVTRGRVMLAQNNTLVVNVLDGSDPGMHKFVLNSGSPVQFFDRDGNAIKVLDIRAGQELTGVRIVTDASPVKVTQEHVEELKAAPAAPAPAPAAPAPAPAAPEAAPAPVLPSTGSSLPLVLVLAVAFLALGASLTWMRRF